MLVRTHELFYLAAIALDATRQRISTSTNRPPRAWVAVGLLERRVLNTRRVVNYGYLEVVPVGSLVRKDKRLQLFC